MASHGIFRPPAPTNEPVKDYAPGSPERAELQKRLAEMERERLDVPCVIGGEEVRTGDTVEAVMPHRKEHALADVHQAGPDEVERAIKASADAWHDWSRTSWEERAAVFLRAAELLAGPWRTTMVAATMLNQSKTAHQAEIDAAAELIDFFRFNVEFMTRVYSEQPVSSPGVWNRLEYRPLEGFVFAVSPFNFTAIGGNLTSSPALMGNTVVWKPASTAALSAYYTMRLFQEAGLPDGVVNLVYGRGSAVGDPVLASPNLAGIHFTGSTAVFQNMWQDGRREHRALPQLPADRRRDRRQGLHRRPPLRRRRLARDGDRPWLVRIPGAEVLGRIACLRAVESLARSPRPPRRADRRASRSATSPTSRTSWAP